MNIYHLIFVLWNQKDNLLYFEYICINQHE